MTCRTVPAIPPALGRGLADRLDRGMDEVHDDPVEQGERRPQHDQTPAAERNRADQRPGRVADAVHEATWPSWSAFVTTT